MAEPRRKTPGPVSREWLMRAGAHYLERYATSSENFRRVLERKTKRRMMLRDEFDTDHSDLIADVVSRFDELGFLDDRSFAEAKVRSFRRKGLSIRMVEAKLSEKGVDRGTIDAVVAEDETLEETAARSYAKRRRLGPWRLRDRAERRDRDVAAMMRAGFAYPLASSVVDGEADDERDEA
ncbi:RecX family transcriptional regulator [Fulvimarina endophytica]|uniref:Regulatory protein RecX n=1 Tax=Fulvimarina endophytica TaxID=2293836 RepID=A0A371XAG7_9HYPH|nr:regulatory protein RecX [Fulvimarina endophytica]RFC66182.1 RecX family transcriptional regulator [Fulvimarina endophytica]